MHARIPATLAVVIALAPSSTAQTEAVQPKWAPVFEIGIRAADNATVAKVVQELRGLAAAAGKKDGSELSIAKVLLDPQNLASLPWRLRAFVDTGSKANDAPAFVQLQHGAAIPWVTALRDFAPTPVEGVADAWHTPHGFDFGVASGKQGGFFLNITTTKSVLALPGMTSTPGGQEDPAAKRPKRTSLWSANTELATATRLDTKLLEHVRGMPFYALFDLSKTANPREAQQITGLFGPRGMTMGFGLTTLGGRPVLNAFSAARPGAGIVGSYAEPNPAPAQILGSLDFTPKALATVNLGSKVPRTLMTLIRGIPKDSPMAAAKDTLEGFLESWTGELSAAATGEDLAADFEFEATGFEVFGELEQVMTGLGKSMRGVLAFGVEEGSGAEIAASIRKLLRGPMLEQLGMPLRVQGEGEKTVFGLPFDHYLSIAGKDELVVIGVDSSAEAVLKTRDGALHGQKRVEVPRKLRMTHNPMNMWLGHQAIRYLMLPYRAIGKMGGVGNDDPVYRWWIDGMCSRLMTEDLVFTLGWNRSMGYHLRYMF